jgi:hypothetical protein
MYKTSEWIDLHKPKVIEPLHVNPHAIEMDRLVVLVADYVANGTPVNTAITLVGKDQKWFRARLNDNHHEILNNARKIRNKKQ